MGREHKLQLERTVSSLGSMSLREMKMKVKKTVREIRVTGETERSFERLRMKNKT